MKFVKLFSIIFAFAAVLYIAGCSSAEQTTARIAYQQGDYAKAEMEFDKETKQNPQNEEAWFYLAMSRLKQNKLNEAKAAFTEYQKIGKNTFSAELEKEWGATFDEGIQKFNVAEGLAKENKTDDAVKNYKTAIGYFQLADFLKPSDSTASNNAKIAQGRIIKITLGPLLTRGDEFVNSGKYSEAVSEYKLALDKAGSDNTLREAILNGLSIAYLKWSESLRTADDQTYKEKYAEALPYVEELNTITTSNEMKVTTYDWLVVLYGGLGRTEDATNAMKKRDELKNK